MQRLVFVAPPSARPRCHCGYELIPAPGRKHLVCPIHMPPMRQGWRKPRPRKAARRRRLAPLPHEAVLVLVEAFLDPETGQMGLVEA